MNAEIKLLEEFLVKHKDQDPIETARLFGIDISLLLHNLSLPQTERIRQLQEWMRLQSSVKWWKSKSS